MEEVGDLRDICSGLGSVELLIKLTETIIHFFRISGNGSCFSFNFADCPVSLYVSELSRPECVRFISQFEVFLFYF